MSEPAVSRGGPGGGLGSGLGRVLVFVYGLFAVAATSRASVQLITKFSTAPIAYLLSALAAVIYIVATVGLVRGVRPVFGLPGRTVATICCTVELVGVVVVGALSLLLPGAFPDATVWSAFGQGYGYIPLVLPVLGLLYLRKN